MKIAVIHGQAHHGNTYGLTHMLLDRLHCDKEDIFEVNVNKISPCAGCVQCILKDEKLCPQREIMEPIVKALDDADVIILASPNYCMGMTGQLKSFCDHLGYRWLSHRPAAGMAGKIGVAVVTTAGAGAGKTAKSICQQLLWWGVGRSYRLPFAVHAEDLSKISAKQTASLERRVSALAAKINAGAGQSKAGFKAKTMFAVMTWMHRKMAWSPLETAYWKEQGWIK